MKAEAVDLIEKPCGDEALIDAIESAMKRGARTDRSAGIPEAAARIAELSPREREVLDALALGRSNKVIAYNLGISPRTIDVHRGAHGGWLHSLGLQQANVAARRRNCLSPSLLWVTIGDIGRLAEMKEAANGGGLRRPQSGH